MGKNILATKLRHFGVKIKAVSNWGNPMRIHLFALFLAFLLLIMGGIVAVLYLSGVFEASSKEYHAFLERELNNTEARIRRDYNSVVVQALALAERLSNNFESQLKDMGTSPKYIQDYPESLTDLLAKQFPLLVSSLEKTRSSGVLLILDATVNPGLPDSEHSRAGLFIKNMEPSTISPSQPILRFLRGPAPLARSNKMEVLPQWNMEFRVDQMDCYAKTINTAKGHRLPLSRLYYWCHAMSIAKDIDTAMHCLVPLIDSTGHVFGVCGYEISSLFFKLAYSPSAPITDSKVFCIFSPIEAEQMSIQGSLLAGCFRPLDMTDEPMTMKLGKPFTGFEQTGAQPWVGLHRMVSLYPGDSAYQEQWGLAIALQKEDLVRLLTEQNKRLSSLLHLLTAISIAVSALVSWKFTNPVQGTLNTDKAAEQTATPPSALLLDQFINNTDSLSGAERAVFDLYCKGYTAQEIAATLFLSINTIKTHSKRIYTKLNLSSRKELMLYIQMLGNIVHKD